MPSCLPAPTCLTHHHPVPTHLVHILQLDALSLSVLTPTQQAAVEYVVDQSRSASAAVESRLLERVMRMGYTASDLQR